MHGRRAVCNTKLAQSGHRAGFRPDADPFAGASRQAILAGLGAFGNAPQTPSPGSRPMRCAHRVCLFAVFASSLQAQYFEDRPRTMSDGPAPGGTRVVIDFDGDGRLDLLTGSSTTTSFRNVGGGSFTPVASWNGAAGDALPHAVGDYDGDGDLDYCVAGTLMQNQGAGTFRIDPSLSIYTLGPTPSAFLDHDGDGDLDWLVSTGTLRLFANNGSGSFTEVSATALAGFNRGVQDFRVVDLDGDGDRDVIKSGGGFGPLAMHVWRNHGQGQWTEELLPAPTGLGAFGLFEVADFDGDGSLDAAVVGMPGNPYWLLRRIGATWTSTPMNSGPSGAAEQNATEAGDWNGDGRADWVTRLGVWQQTTPLQFAFTPWPAGLQLAGTPMLIDLDLDGRPDAVPRGGQGFIRNRTTGPSYSDRPFVTGGAASTQVAQVRRRSPGSPDVEAVTLASASLRWGTDAPQPGDFDRTLRMQSAGYQSGSDAALFTPTNGGAPGLLLCIAGSVHHFQSMNGALTWSAAAPGLTGTRIACADLDGVPGDEVVLGGSQFSGPRIYRHTPTGFLDISPTLPPAAASAAPGYEQVVLADLDADGDLDVVHEHRWLRNDGGSWTVGEDFAALLPASCRTLLPFDFDGDGRLDLFAGAAAGASRLLYHMPTGWLDASAWLPASAIGAVDRASAGDVDGDGRTDLLIATGTTSNLVLGAPFVATWVPDVGPAGWLADLDHDGRPDLFVGDRVLWNTHTLLTAKSSRPGAWPLQLSTRRTGAPVVQASLVVGVAETMLALPGIGTLFVDPAQAFVLDLPISGGRGSRTVTLPIAAALVGVPLRAQALVFDGARFELSNTVRDLWQ